MGQQASRRAGQEASVPGQSNISDNVISYVYDAIKDKVSTLRLHHRHFKSRYVLVKDFDDFVFVLVVGSRRSRACLGTGERPNGCQQ